MPIPRPYAPQPWVSLHTAPSPPITHLVGSDLAPAQRKALRPAGREGDTIGTLVCERFQCSKNVRRLPVLAYEGYDREAARDRRIDELRLRAAEFAAAVTRP